MKRSADRKFIIVLVCVFVASAIFFAGSSYGKKQLREEYATQIHFEMSRRLDALEQTYSSYAHAVENYLDTNDRALAGESFSLLFDVNSGFSNADSDLLTRYKNFVSDGNETYNTLQGLILGTHSAGSDLSKFDDDTLYALCELYAALSECCHRFEGTYGYCFFYLDYDAPSDEYLTAKAEVDRLLLQLDKIAR